MRLEKLSKDFTPRNQGMFFGIDTESDEPQDVVVEVVDVDADEVVATQLLRGITTAEVNIAPYVKPITDYVPQHITEATLVNVPVANYAVRAEGEESEAIRISVNRTVAECPSAITAMPHNRRICYGESDELLIMMEVGDDINVVITTDMDEMWELQSMVETGLLSLHIPTEMFSEHISEIDVELLYNGDSLHHLHYAVTPPHKNAIRLAWISECGSIERYTFPTVAKCERKATKESIVTREGFKVVGVGAESQISLVSRYEPRQTIQALTEIISSPKVWIDKRGSYSAVAVESSLVDSNIFAEPDCLTLVVSGWRREEKGLW